MITLNRLFKRVTSATIAVATLLMTGSVFANTGDSSNWQFSQLQTNMSDTAGSIWTVVTVVLTLAGLLLIAAGLVSLKQHYTGTGQEKHLTKGVAKLCFGAALFIVVPVAHVLVGGVSGDTTGNAANSFKVASPYNESLGNYNAASTGPINPPTTNGNN